MSSWKKYAAEFIGTATLVFMGCGSAVIAGEKVGFLGIALAFGLSVLVMVYAIGPISGCHINPAITIAMLTAGKIKAMDAVAYIVAQGLGGILGAAVLLQVVERRLGYSLAANGLGQNGYGLHSPMGYSLAGCLAAEIILTALFLFVIFGATSKNAPQGFAGLAIGLSLTLIHIVGIPITGTSVNPARSLGPALMVGGDALSQVWLFVLAPVIGGILAAVVWKWILGQE
ncbi:MAG: aquaporin Z [Candidatus Aminicenantales bacterium]|jgi:aquaporin Z